MLSKLVILLPSFWPLYQGLYLVLCPEQTLKQPSDPSQYKFNWSPLYLITFNLGMAIYGFLSWLSYTFTFPLLDGEEEFSWIYWSIVIIVRDLLITYIIFESWHVLTYQSYAKKLKAKKFNPEMPDESQWKRDRFWSLSGTVISSFHELLLIYLYKNNHIAFYNNFWDFPLYSWVWFFFVSWWRHFHFYFAHRLEHPWFKPKSKWKAFDLGQVLYNVSHSLHHRSYNPGPWSGLSMHPIEHIMYYSCVWFPCLFIPQHPIHFMASKFHATVSPAPGHDGYDSPIGGGAGGYFHYLHHAHYECNYGTDMMPLDVWFGTFEDGSRFQRKKK